MGFLFQEYMNLKPVDETMEKFRNGVFNSFTTTLNRYKDTLELLQGKENESELKDYSNAYSEIDTKYINNLFNEIGYDIGNIELKKIFHDWGRIYTYHYLMEDLWDFFETLPNDIYYATMVYVSQTSTTKELLRQLQRAIKEELLRNRIVVKEYRKSVFIAMSFSSDMVSAREKIMRTIEDRGYKAVLIDEKEHNEQIVPQILEEIAKAEFVVSDLTCHKNGVYYEAGYAKGLGKEVIFTCSEADFENGHFDVKQINTIIWKNVFDLEQKLSKRIEVMMTSELEEQHVPF